MGASRVFKKLLRRMPAVAKHVLHTHLVLAVCGLRLVVVLLSVLRVSGLGWLSGLVGALVLVRVSGLGWLSGLVGLVRLVGALVLVVVDLCVCLGGATKRNAK
jgi:hypothetical protein